MSNAENESCWKSALNFLIELFQFAYFMRLQIIGWTFMILFPYFAVNVVPHLLLGLFDLTSRSEPGTHSTINVILFAIFVYAVVWGLLVSARVTRRRGRERFAIEPVSKLFRAAWHDVPQDSAAEKPFASEKLAVTIFFLAMSAASCVSMFYVALSNSPRWDLDLLVILGTLVVFLLILRIAQDFIRLSLIEEDARRLKGFLVPHWPDLPGLDKWIKESEVITKYVNPLLVWVSAKARMLLPVKNNGYFKKGDKAAERGFYPEHLAAGVFLVIFFCWWVFVGIAGSYAWYFPALINLLSIAMILVWIFGGLIFLVDGFRLPSLYLFIIVTLVLQLVIPWFFAGYFDNESHAFKTIPLRRDAVKFKSPAEILDGAKSDGSPFVILVATEGGGIQAAAWTAAVLTGLERTCRQLVDNEENRKELGEEEIEGYCSEKIKMISAVSGGSVGSMFVVNSYRDGRLPNGDEDLEEIFRQASASSLDSVSWGMAYPDLLQSFFWFIPYRSQGREAALEDQWIVNAGEGSSALKGATLNSWATESKPQVIFNVTSVETGTRVMLTNVQFGNAPESEETLSWEPWTFEDATGCRPDSNVDLEIVTAARLSASFPFVTPVTHPGVDKGTCGKDYRKLHFADGGYYDNFGVLSLTNWVDVALEDKERSRRLTESETPMILVIRIGTGADTGKTGSDGGGGDSEILLQEYAPLMTLYNIRTAAQRENAEIVFLQLSKKWNERARQEGRREDLINSVTFRYDDPSGSDEQPPLSWHLTEEQKKNVRCGWYEYQKYELRDQKLENECGSKIPVPETQLKYRKDIMKNLRELICNRPDIKCNDPLNAK